MKVAAEYPVGIRQRYLLPNTKSTGVISHSYLKRSFEVHKLFSFGSEPAESPRVGVILPQKDDLTRMSFPRTRESRVVGAVREPPARCHCEERSD